MKAIEFSPEEWTADELKARQEKVQEMLKRNEPTLQEQQTTEATFVQSAASGKYMVMMEGLPNPKPPRAERSDKGKPRKRKDKPVPEPQRAGVLTPEQASRLRALTNAELKAHLALAEAERNMKKASTDVLDFVDSLTKP